MGGVDNLDIAGPDLQLSLQHQVRLGLNPSLTVCLSRRTIGVLLSNK